VTGETKLKDLGEASVAQELAKASPPPVATSNLDEEDRRLDLARKASDIGLGKRVANGVLLAMAFQIVAADVVFYLYGHASRWRYPVAAIDGWLAATVIQVIAVVLVITRYLFPTGGSSGR
jgi:hypothetical protein